MEVIIINSDNCSPSTPHLLLISTILHLYTFPLFSLLSPASTSRPPCLSEQYLRPCSSSIITSPSQYLRLVSLTTSLPPCLQHTLPTLLPAIPHILRPPSLEPFVDLFTQYLRSLSALPLSRWSLPLPVSCSAYPHFAHLGHCSSSTIPRRIPPPPCLRHHSLPVSCPNTPPTTGRPPCLHLSLLVPPFCHFLPSSFLPLSWRTTFTFYLAATIWHTSRCRLSSLNTSCRLPPPPIPAAFLPLTICPTYYENTITST